MSSKISNAIPISIFKKFRPAIIEAPFILLVLLSGCGFFSAVPVTLKEFKDYVIGQQESFSYPLNLVLDATIYNLREMGFTILRVENFNQKSLIHADWKDTSVKLSMETITPKLTKMVCKVRRGTSSREYSSEEELFDNVQDTLKQRQRLGWREFVKGMATVHVSPDNSSSVIAYLGVGAKAEVVETKGEWAEIALMDNCTGFISLKHLQPASAQKTP